MATNKSKPEAAEAAEKKSASEKSKAKAASAPGKVETARVFIEESRAELRKVTWPGKKEIKVTTLAVLALVVVMSLFLGIMDLGLVKAVEAITGLGR